MSVTTDQSRAATVGAPREQPTATHPAPGQHELPSLDRLERLESDAVQIIRDVVGELERPALLRTDSPASVVLVQLARKAFLPGPMPLPLIEHPDDAYDAIFTDALRQDDKAPHALCLHACADDHQHRERPGFWWMHNARHTAAEQLRVSPLATWTPDDVQQYIKQEGLAAPNAQRESAKAAADNDQLRTVDPPWYDGPEPLLGVPTDGVPKGSASAFRLNVQRVCRPQSHDLVDYRGYAGQVATGEIRVGDRVQVQPGGAETTVIGIDGLNGPLHVASAGQSVTLQVADDLDISRGAMLSSAAEPAHTGRHLTGVACWSGQRPLRTPTKALLRIGTLTVQVAVSAIEGRFNAETSGYESAESLQLNDIGRLRFRTGQDVAYDAFHDSPRTGAFLLLERDGTLLAAGRLDAPVAEPDEWEI